MPAGHYTIIVDFGKGVIVTRELNASFNVIPESPIGAIAKVLSSYATLTTFLLVRQTRK